MIDFVVEILEDDIDYEDVKPNNRADKPLCQKLCLIGGQKAYNEFHNVFQIAARSWVRVWLS